MTSEDFDITKEEFDGLFNSAVEFTHTLLKNKPKDIMPTLFVFTTNKNNKRGTIVVGMAADFNEEEEKHKLMRSIGAKLAMEKEFVLAAVLISEAWVSSAALKEEVQPRHASDKREAVVIAGHSTCKKHSRMVSQPLLRYNEGFMADGKPMYDTATNPEWKGEFPLLNPFFQQHIIQWGKQVTR